MDVPGGVLVALLRLTDLQTVLASRCASNTLRAAGAEVIDTLQALDGKLPAEAWEEAFPLANKLVAAPTERFNSIAFFTSLVQLAPTLPQRLESLVVRASLMGYHGRRQWIGEHTPLLARALLASPCSAALAVLVIQAPISDAAADMLLAGLPALQRAELEVYASRKKHVAWRPAPRLAGPQPALRLQLAQRANRGLDLSLACLGAELRSLDFSGFFCCSLAPLSRLTGLERLAIELPAPGAWGGESDEREALEGLLALRRLRELRLPGALLPARLWPQLAAALPGLHTLALAGLKLGAEAAAAPALASLSVLARCGTGGLVLCDDAPRARLEGLLARQLPRLRRLSASTLQLPQLAAALQGHPALEELEVEAPLQAEQAQGLAPLPGEVAAGAGGLGLGQVAAGLPALLELRLAGCFSCDDALLRDVAHCGRLVALALVCTAAGGRGVSGAGLAALAEGPCSGSLRRLELVVEEGLAPEPLARLLREGAAGGLRQVGARVRVPKGLGRGGGPSPDQMHALLLGQPPGATEAPPIRLVGCETVKGRGGRLLDCAFGLG
jgi:hypothetical protein